MTKQECESRFCNKIIDIDNCYSYVACGQKVFWCNKGCYKEHTGEIKQHNPTEK